MQFIEIKVNFPQEYVTIADLSCLGRLVYFFP